MAVPHTNPGQGAWPAGQPWSIFQQGGGPEAAVGWAQQALKMIGAPVTPGNVQFMYDWEKSEGGGGAYNPLNQGPVPGQPNLTSSGQQFGGGAANYDNWQSGLKGFQAYMNMPAYAGVRDSLIKNDPAGARSALWASPWAASHYGYGANWAGVPTPGGNPMRIPSGGGGALPGSDSTGGNPATCAWLIGWGGLPGTSWLNDIFGSGGNVGSGSVCLISKTQTRALIGTGLLLGGMLLVLWPLLQGSRQQVIKIQQARGIPAPSGPPGAPVGPPVTGTIPEGAEVAAAAA
jgi:hypothetical protein